jgi:hypothetical protein
MYETLELGIEEWVRERKKAKGIFDKTLEFRVGEVEIPVGHPRASHGVRGVLGWRGNLH